MDTTQMTEYQVRYALEELLKAVEFYAMPEHVFVGSAAIAADKGWLARYTLENLRSMGIDIGTKE